MDLISMDARHLHPFTLICSGPTGSGKTQFVKRMTLEGESVVDKPPDRILWLYGEYQDAYDELKASISNIRFVEGFPPDLNALVDPSVNNLVVVDDLMLECSKDSRLTSAPQEHVRDLHCAESLFGFQTVSDHFSQRPLHGTF